MNLLRGVRRNRTRLTVLTAALVGLVLLLVQLPANALDVTNTPSPVTGNATWFSGLGGPYGGCGMPQANLESQDFVALNVYNLPGDYSTFYNRPMPDSLSSAFGMWNNGHNCDRWVEVTIGDYCTGVNDGAPNEAFCRNGSWTSDAYNGATLTMLVADSCGDGNAWCRDDPYHLDLAQPALNRFVKNGAPVGDMYPNHWNNRHLTWQFVPAPNYTGDIQIGFLQGAQTWWPALAISHLPNGIHGVEYWANGSWQQAQMDGDMGQAYIVGPTGQSTFQIRVRDVNDTLINNGRVYTVSLPAACQPQCGEAYVQTTYTTSDQPVTTPTAGASGSAGTGTCTAALAVSNSWPDGYQAAITVKNTGTAATTGWSVGVTLPSGQTVRSSWNATIAQSGQEVTATNVGYNGAIPAGGTTSWGLVVDGTGSPPSTLTCTAS